MGTALLNARLQVNKVMDLASLASNEPGSLYLVVRLEAPYV